MATTVVTGASAGIGRATALELMRRGRTVVGVGRDRVRLQAVGRGASAPFFPLAIDLTEPGATDRAIEAAIELAAPIDALVIAHGIAEHRALDGVDEAILLRHLRANLIAPVLLCRAFARVATRPATIVLVGSTLAHRPAPETTAYAASKAALLAASKAIAQELASDRIRIASVSPGLVDTDMIAPLRLAPGEAMPTGEVLKARLAAQRDALAGLSLAKRLGTPDEIARAITFVLDNELVVGDLVIDGGLLARG